MRCFCPPHSESFDVANGRISNVSEMTVDFMHLCWSSQSERGIRTMLKNGRVDDVENVPVNNVLATAAGETRPATMEQYTGVEFRAVDVARDGHSMRLRFKSRNGEISLCISPSNLSGMIPLLLRAEAQGYKNAGSPNAVRPLVTSDVGVSISNGGKHLAITMVLPEDRGRIGFQVDPHICRGLMRLLSLNLGEPGSLPMSH
jgi:hypothetical protein